MVNKNIIDSFFVEVVGMEGERERNDYKKYTSKRKVGRKYGREK